MLFYQAESNLTRCPPNVTETNGNCCKLKEAIVNIKMMYRAEAIEKKCTRNLTVETTLYVIEKSKRICALFCKRNNSKEIKSSFCSDNLQTFIVSLETNSS